MFDNRLEFFEKRQPNVAAAVLAITHVLPRSPSLQTVFERACLLVEMFGSFFRARASNRLLRTPSPNATAVIALQYWKLLGTRRPLAIFLLLFQNELSCKINIQSRFKIKTPERFKLLTSEHLPNMCYPSSRPTPSKPFLYTMFSIVLPLGFSLGRYFVIIRPLHARDLPVRIPPSFKYSEAGST